ncbi:YqaA family protein [Rhizobium rhizoryzae]|uniref:Membrane protein YqaA with SNARE-associated domain n=2 Tax=Rhizobium rhizoryzae TaxID=451876 RepID=A0A7W6LH32_9HYPH|nr:YqaA family protein [Rhizobium rhizoryzae]MBB4144274.1 membrane protein YqaA with SNARE-associated domain [Rhizobium rhizoryzae]
MRNRPDMMAYLGLMATAFVAATLLPAQSEALLAYLVVQAEHPVVLLVVFATIGNVAGSVVNWALGRGIERFRNRRWFPVSEAGLNQASRWYGKYGRWSLLASWVPIIGDPITVVAGVLREPLASFLIFVTIAKFARYCVIAALASNAF